MSSLVSINNSDIFVRTHPREEGKNINFIDEYNFNHDNNCLMYQQIAETNIVIIFVGLSGWLCEYSEKIIYVDDKIFNRGNYVDNIRFTGKNIVRSPDQLTELLLKLNLD